MRSLVQFLRDEEGSLVAQGVIVLPLLLWAFIGLFVYWDAFREMNTVQKAGYTLSDVLSRQETGLSNAYVVGMKSLFDYLVGDPDKANAIRVTSITRNAATMPALTTARLQRETARIPSMAPNDYALIVEVHSPYTPAFEIRLEAQNFTEFIVTRPRFLHCLPMDNVPCPVS